MKRADLGWLAGIIDGEGTIGLAINQGSPWVRIQIPSTTPAIITKVERVLDRLGIRHNASTAKIDGRLPLTTVSVHGKPALDLLGHLEDHLVRQVARSTDARKFFEPLYAGLTARGTYRERTIGWTDELRVEWDAIRKTHNRKAA